MKANLQMNFSQSLTLTPQLQQAIKLLQLSSIELNQEIQQALETNPLLEQVETPQESGTPRAKEDSAMPNLGEDPYTNSWQDVRPSHHSNHFQDDNYNYENFHTATEDLSDHLIWQMRLTNFSDIETAIATAIIDAINDDGFLTCDVNELQESISHDIHAEDAVKLDAIEAVLHRIQYFDPVGVGARSLSECLQIQLSQLQKDTPHLDTAKKIIENDLDFLGQRNYAQLKKTYKLDDNSLKQTLMLIQSLNPRPGSLIPQTQTEYIVPDVSIFKENGQWTVQLNKEHFPKIQINDQYAALIKRSDNSADNTFLRDRLNEARWFIKSLTSRHETLLRVTQCIVAHQKEFFEHGEEAMKPLVLSNIAEVLDLHESTISRVTTQKYMHSPRGVFELKYFFSSHVGTQSGGECSSTAIRAVLKKLIAAENPQKPLSDNKLASILAMKGINVARRTIAKYREAMNIPPSNERKELEEII